MDGNGATDLIWGFDGDEELSGSQGGDFIIGLLGDGKMWGGVGNDGDDVLDCGPGFDIGIGGPGTDICLACEWPFSC